MKDRIIEMGIGCKRLIISLYFNPKFGRFKP